MNIPWYLSRATGLSAYLVLFAVVMLGLAIRTRGLDRLVKRWKVTDIHIFLSLLALGFVFVHAGVLLWDGFVGYSLKDILVPFSTSYRSLWTAIGIGMMYLLVIIAISFPARRLIGYRAWRALHYSTFVAYIGALLHGVFTGTDSQVAWAQAIYLTTAGAVLAVVIYRIALWQRKATAEAEKAAQLEAQPGMPVVAWSIEPEKRAIENRAFRFGAGAISVAAIIFVAAGLGPFHWLGSGHEGGDDQASGTNLAAANPAAQPRNGSSSAQSQSPNGFRDTFQGTASETTSGQLANFTLDGNASGDMTLTFNIQLQLTQGRGGRAQATSNVFTVRDASGNTICSGQLTQMDDDGFAARCNGSGLYQGKQLQLQGSFDQGLAQQVTGTLEATITS